MSAGPQLRKIAEGREAEIYAWRDGTVLRLLRHPDAREQLEREARAMEAARAAGVRVPAAGEITLVDGRPGLVMERVDGIDLLTLVGRRPWMVWWTGSVSGRYHAGLHEVVAPPELPPLRERFRRRIASSPLVPGEIAGRALAELDGLPDGDRICHGDFHPGNLIRADGELVLIDWTAVARGDPTADYVRTDMMLRLGSVPPGSPLLIRFGARFARGLMRQAYARAYRRLRPVDRALAARWLTVVAANRLVENIEPERPRLLRLLERTG
jgi:aminoglycoside phosphotransferase (APT) family kinase protein